jgi:hypothetical protein
MDMYSECYIQNMDIYIPEYIYIYIYIYISAPYGSCRPPWKMFAYLFQVLARILSSLIRSFDSTRSCQTPRNKMFVSLMFVKHLETKCLFHMVSSSIIIT